MTTGAEAALAEYRIRIDGLTPFGQRWRPGGTLHDALENATGSGAPGPCDSGGQYRAEFSLYDDGWRIRGQCVTGEAQDSGSSAAPTPEVPNRREHDASARGKTGVAEAAQAAASQQRRPPASDDRLAMLSEGDKDGPLFREYSRIFSQPPDRVWQTLIDTLQKDSEPIVKVDREQRTVVTEVKRHGMLGMPNYRKYYAIVEDLKDGRSNVRVKPFRYRQNMEKSSMFQIVLDPEKDQDRIAQQADDLFSSMQKLLDR
jgi:hypothetical protein